MDVEFMGFALPHVVALAALDLDLNSLREIMAYERATCRGRLSLRVARWRGTHYTSV